MIESVICYNTTLWWSTISCADKIAINRICKQITKIIKTDISSIDDLYIKYVLKKVKCVVSIETHPLHQYFSHMRLRSGTRLRALPCEIPIYRKSFVQNSINLFNKY